ncbi:MAG: hypothetical protein AB2693_23685 [Candidatus Thiodiazotropha sp.]
MPNSKHVSNVVLNKESFEYFSMFFFLVQPHDPLGLGKFGPSDHRLNDLVKDQQATLSSKFQASGRSGSEEEDFLMFFNVFLWSKPKSLPGVRPILQAILGHEVII